MLNKARGFFKKYIDTKYPGWDLTIALRYLPIADDLKKIHKNGETILEIGSEITGITPYLKKHVTGVDIAFDMTKRNKYLTPVKASVLNLPFEDKSYDYVISVDMLEHIPEDSRAKAIAEMIRVTRKKMYLAFPSGAEAEQVDKYLYEYYKNKRGEEYQYLSEHLTLGLPDYRKIEQILRGYNEFKFKVYRYTNIFLWKMLLRLGLSGEKFQSSLYRRLLILLPLLRQINFEPTYRIMFVLQRSKLN